MKHGFLSNISRSSINRCKHCSFNLTSSSSSSVRLISLNSNITISRSQRLYSSSSNALESSLSNNNNNNDNIDLVENHAVISTFELFSIGIGPSSSHTVGPMKASKEFLENLKHLNNIIINPINNEACSDHFNRVTIDVFGSLALTGQGHGTPNAIILGLLGHEPETIEIEKIPQILSELSLVKRIPFFGTQLLFNPESDLILHKNIFRPGHSNSLRFNVFDAESNLVACQEYYSIGGGFIIANKFEFDTLKFNYNNQDNNNNSVSNSNFTFDKNNASFKFKNSNELLQMTRKYSLSISKLVELNEGSSPQFVHQKTLSIWNAMEKSIISGMSPRHVGSVLPGGLNVKRRAPLIAQSLIKSAEANTDDEILTALQAPRLERNQPLSYYLSTNLLNVNEWASVFAMSVNEENATGGRVVTSPTNGASGVIPAVLKYYLEFLHQPQPSPQSSINHVKAELEQKIKEFLLTSAAIGMICKHGASLSAAEVGCQGEVGVASSMAAAGLTAVLGGSPYQIENAAEIALEHHLGLTCDPIGGLVQIPCIERNAIGAAKAITASQLALRGDGSHRVSLDQTVVSMKQTGLDMNPKYKETSLGGLAINVPIC